MWASQVFINPDQVGLAGPLGGPGPVLLSEERGEPGSLGAPDLGRGRSQTSWVFLKAPDPAHGCWMLRFSGGLKKKKV